ncbi:hypothetical protein FACS1894185_6740 [Betaproteobacteria bacterium]|nr:hypothetical protein FACS1894185_6740 [Betaproteobacteria bacterium]GHU15713.1 hypothetical protein FACS189441_7750 [Betaproteobacteria bacterium]
MFTLLLIVSSSQPLPDPCRLISKLGQVHVEFDEAGEAYNRYVVDLGNDTRDGWIAISLSKDAESDYEDDVLLEIKKIIPDPCFFFIEGGGKNRSANLINQFVLSLDASEPFLLDNDIGVIEDIKSVQKKIKAGVDWSNLHSKRSADIICRIEKRSAFHHLTKY